MYFNMKRMSSCENNRELLCAPSNITVAFLQNSNHVWVVFVSLTYLVVLYF